MPTSFAIIFDKISYMEIANTDSIDRLNAGGASTMKRKEELIDILLFMLCEACAVFLNFRKIITEGEGQDFGQLLQPYLLWPLMIVFVALWFYLAYRRSKYAGVEPFHKILGSLFVTYFVIRFVGYVLFPQGEQTFQFALKDSTYSVYYSGFGWYERITEYISEMLELVCFYLMFIYYPSFKLHRKRLVRFFVWLVIAIAIGLALLICTAYAMGAKPLIMEWDPNSDTFSIIGHKNFYGLFLMGGVFGCMILTFMKPNIVYVLLSTWFTILTLLLFSRTPFLLCALMMVAIAVICPIFNFKKDKPYFIICMTVVAICLVVFVIFITFLKETSFGKILWDLIDKFTNFGTLDNRRLLREAGISMISSDFYFVMFGFGKTPFYNIFKAFQIAHNGEMVITCHQAWLSCIATTGIVGLAFVVSLDLFVIYMILSLAKIKKFDMMTCYLFGGLILLIYTFYEFRMLFFNDSFSNNTMLFYLCYLFPILYSYTMVDDAKKIKENMPNRLVYPSLED